MKFIWSVIAFSAASVVTAFPAIAGRNDDAWAQCIWDNVPRSAANWLAMPELRRSYGLQEVPPEYVLQFRLQAACHSQLTLAGRSAPPSFNSRAVRRSLARMRPQIISDDRLDPRAYRCTRFFLNDEQMERPAGYDWGFGGDTEQAQFSRITFFFAAQGRRASGFPTKVA